MSEEIDKSSEKRDINSDDFNVLETSLAPAHSFETNSPPSPPALNSGHFQSIIGKEIDNKYRVVSLLGSGGMGAVYKAEHMLMGRTVAIKVLHPHLVENELLLKRFQHEAQITSKLRHPNAITTFDFGLYDGAPYIVMEYVEGKTLKALIAEVGALPEKQTRRIFIQVGSALQQAHELGIVHRDLKPDNIMLVPQHDGTTQAMVLDFGIAKILKEQNEPNRTVMTQAGTFFGTPKYASPEQVLEKSLDGRSDLYTIGILLYESLTGEVPFDAPSVMELLMKQLHNDPIPPREFRPNLGISPQFETVVMRCLRKDPEERYRNVEEFLIALRETGNDTTQVNNSLLKAQTAEQKNSSPYLLPKILLLVVMLSLAIGAGYFGLFSETVGKSGKSSEKDDFSRSLNKEPETTPPAVLRSESTPRPKKEEAPALAQSPREYVPITEEGLAAFGSALFGRPSENSAEPLENELVKAAPPLDSAEAIDEGSLHSEDLPTPTPSNELGNTEKNDPVHQLNVLPTPMESPSEDNTLNNSDDKNLGGDNKQRATSVPTSNPTFDSNAKTAEAAAFKKEFASIEGGKKEAMKAYTEGTALYRQKRYAEAAAKFELAIRNRSDAIGSMISLGNCYLRLGKSDKALTAFLLAVKVDPRYGPAHYNLAAYYAVTGENSKALESLRKAIALDSRARRSALDEPDFAKLRALPEFRGLVGR